jgi:hypothetical protein
VTMFLRGLDRLIGCVVAAAKWLALPLITLLFLQWPLRELFRVTPGRPTGAGCVCAVRRRQHHCGYACGNAPRSRSAGPRYSARTRRRLNQVGTAVGFMPWALLLLIAGKTAVVSSIQGLESFQDSGNPGYFLIKVARRSDRR